VLILEKYSITNAYENPYFFAGRHYFNVLMYKPSSPRAQRLGSAIMMLGVTGHMPIYGISGSAL
jgi:hypothetical protein